MKNNRLSAREWSERIVLALLFIAIGSLIMVIFSPWRPLLSRVADYLGRIGLAAFLLAVMSLARRSQRFEKYWPVLLGLFIMNVAVSLDWIFGIYLIDYLGVTDDTPAGWALAKLNECIVVACVIILFTKMSRGTLGSIYIQKGNLKLGLIVGLSTFFLAAAGSIPMASLFNARDLSLIRILPWTPWLLIYVLANATMEELLFRGLFLRRLEPFFGKILSNLVIALVFTMIHGAVNYSADQYLFLAILFPLALVWGYVMQKTDGVWGSVLFHAGMDIPIMLGIFSNLS
ncbi:MAG: lysostaphin resistance A-like protein [Anaerolineae bacterium]